MVAYNLMLALFPFALLVLFIFGQLIQSADIEDSVIRDLQRLFPAAEQDTLEQRARQIRESSTTIGVAAALGAIWIGASFWGAMDTAFCRIYHVECRGWVEQKRFALVMLVVASALPRRDRDHPDRRERAHARAPTTSRSGSATSASCAASSCSVGALAITFVIVCLIYYFVPKGHMPWRGVWPGALFSRSTAGDRQRRLPVYLAEISTVDGVGGAIGFVLVALIWFYLLAWRSSPAR